MNQKITLKDVSRLANVSVATVSRVINNQPHVRPEVRNRVLQIVEEIGYRPNPAARSLAGYESRIIGLVVPETTHVLFTDPYFARLIQGIAEACRTHDYALSLFLFHALDDGARLAPRLLSRQLFDGLILTATQIEDPFIDQLLASDIPFVLVGNHENPHVNFVDADNVMGAFTAVSHLLHLGYQRIATITGPMTNQAAIQRKQGYLDALSRRGRAVDSQLIVEGDYSLAGGEDAMARLLPQKPDAVFVASDMMASGALNTLRRHDIAVPDEIAVVGYDDLPSTAHLIPPLTTVRQPIKRAGIQAVETLMDILRHGAYPPRRILLPTQLILRDSCGSKLASA